ncbi:MULTISPECIES: GrpB family protein [unclassified Pseudomonas]|uniref:GrpB family protein n=1 Tax=unclassified Pseudomonas TaxID=196821 RepID=UPI0009F5679C|nr:MULTISPECIES: GrpB family protein [unclassified Pseudomonas]QIH09398.1 GrpB family protein [Pseudomonas sp. BIOMIG1BAC]
MSPVPPAATALPVPIKVELRPHDPQWAEQACRVAGTLHAALGDNLLQVHHIGSTAIPGIVAKPVLDLLPEVRSLAELDACQRALQELGYAWRGELGLPGRRYCSLDDPDSGQRLVQLHCYAQGSPEIERHLAFADHLRQHPGIAQQYQQEKLRCQALHPGDSHAYSDCKDAWIQRVQAQALAERQRNH